MPTTSIVCRPCRSSEIGKRVSDAGYASRRIRASVDFDPRQRQILDAAEDPVRHDVGGERIRRCSSPGAAVEVDLRQLAFIRAPTGKPTQNRTFVPMGCMRINWENRVSRSIGRTAEQRTNSRSAPGSTARPVLLQDRPAEQRFRLRRAVDLLERHRGFFHRTRRTRRRRPGRYSRGFPSPARPSPQSRSGAGIFRPHRHPGDPHAGDEEGEE